MFDELNDPTPPIGDSRQFAEVAERARSIRRRRRAVMSTIGATVLVAGGVAVIGAIARDGDRAFISTETPETATSTPTSTLEASPLPTTPPTSDVDVPTSAAAPSTTTIVPPTTTTMTTGDEGSRLRALVAITADGDAVYFPPVGNETSPILIYDGPDPDDAVSSDDSPNAVDRIEYSPVYRQTVVGLCCDPAVGTVLVGADDRLPLDGTVPENLSGDTGFGGDGYAPTLDPEGGRQVTIGPDNTIVVADTTSGFDASVTLPEQAGEAWDLAWLDRTTIMVIGRGENVWTRTMVTYDFGSISVDRSFSFALLSEFADLRFAGTAIDGEVAVHDVGTDDVLSGTVGDYGDNNGDASGSSLRVITLPGPALSAWFFDPGQLIWVDTDRTLRVGDRVIDGEYTWARR